MSVEKDIDLENKKFFLDKDFRTHRLDRLINIQPPHSLTDIWYHAEIVSYNGNGTTHILIAKDTYDKLKIYINSRTI
jgi:hypothetical protein